MTPEKLKRANDLTETLRSLRGMKSDMECFSLKLSGASYQFNPLGDIVIDGVKQETINSFKADVVGQINVLIESAKAEFEAL